MHETVLKKMSNVNMKKNDLDQFRPLIFLERRCARKLSKSICVYSEKIKAKCMKEDV